MTRTIESHKTALTLMNEAGFYADVKDLMQTLAAHIVAGKYDEAKALNGFTRLISQHVNGGAEWRKVYAPWKPTVADRKLAAAEMLEHYSEQLREIAEDMTGPEWVQVNIGYGDRLDSVPDALRKAGILPHNYTQVKCEGNRTNEIVALFNRNAIKVGA